MRKTLLVIGVCVGLLVLAKLVGLFHFRPVPAPPTTLATTWTIKFHTASGSIQYDGVDFKPDKSQGGCQYATGTPNPKDLVICQNDVVLWQATTPGQQHDLIVFMTDQILSDHGNPQDTFVGKDGGVTAPPGVATASPDGKKHEWYVVVIDRQNPGGSAHDDPKIKIGN